VAHLERWQKKENTTMGGWGYGCFENDDALDWVSNDLEGSDDYSVVFDALQHVADLDEEEYLEMPEAGAALAAAEVLVAALGSPSSNLPPDVADWVQSHPLDDPKEFVPIALKAVERVGRNSEFQGNWSAPDGEAEWQAVLADLKRRLKK
jgi:uncharacterized protein DUF4259